MKYSIFLGCTIPSRAMNYELSTRKVAEALGIDLVDLDFGCCGFPIELVDEIKALALGARNLTLAKEKELMILALCSACAEMLTKTQKSLSENEDIHKRVNRLLEKSLGEKYKDGGVVKHFARFLYEDYGIKKIKEKIKKPLDGIKIATHYGCHYVRPSEIYDGFDDPERPETLDDLVEATGAAAIDYRTKMSCCGGEVAGMDEKVALEMTKNKIVDLIEKEVDAIVLICPFCSIMYDRQQNNILGEIGNSARIPVLYYPQLLGLALGLEKDSLGFDLNATNVDGLLRKIGV